MIRFVSHEVRTPLNIIKGGLSLLRDDIYAGVPIEDLESLICKLETSVVEAVYAGITLALYTYKCDLISNFFPRIVSDLLNFESISENKFDNAMEEMDLANICSQSQLDTYAMFARSKDVFFHSSSHTGPGEIGEMSTYVVRGDEGKLNVLIRNLVTNALKFTPRNGSVTVCKTLEYPPDKPMKPFLKITVTDTGIGIDAEHAKNLFTQFGKSSFLSSTMIEGSGLGLFISKQIVRSHGGTIDVHSEGKGMGTTFSVTLPLATRAISVILDEILGANSLVLVPCQSTYVTTTSTSEVYRLLKNKVYPEPSIENENDVGCNTMDTREGVRLPTGPNIYLNLLLVDDSHIQTLIHKNSLKRFFGSANVPYEVRYYSANDGTIALQELMKLKETEGRYHDVIVLDHFMVEMHGPETAEAIRKLVGSSVFIIGLTGITSEDDINNFLRAGANTVLSKPVDLNILANLIVKGFKNVTINLTMEETINDIETCECG